MRRTGDAPGHPIDLWIVTNDTRLKHSLLSGSGTSYKFVEDHPQEQALFLSAGRTKVVS